jgi:PTH1 family peptidyl-tRNA hydrolase
LPLGQLRLREAGGSGGHKGLCSIIESLGGCEKFARLRVGIGRIGPMGTDLTDHVLGKFGAAEREAAESVAQEASEAVECVVKEGLTKAMNKYNRRKGESV